jgi:exoribonuclease R
VARRVLEIDSEKAPGDEQDALRSGLAAIRRQYALPDAFPEPVVREAGEAEALPPPDVPDHTRLPLVTLDPPGSLDLDQAMALERRPGGRYRVWYAIADVSAFVRPGGEVDREARRRVETLYLPDGRVPLYPATLGEGRASLLPGCDRSALLWRIDLDSSADVTSVDVRRALVRSRARFDYPAVQKAVGQGAAPDELALLPELGGLLQQREVSRGGISLNCPVQTVVAGPDGWRLKYRAALPVEDWNAQISLLTGMAAADLMLYAGIGVLRVLPEPEIGTVNKLRRVARALKVRWPDGLPYEELIRRMDGEKPKDLAFLTEATSLLRGASYEAFDGGMPLRAGHSALAAVYAHVTAPLRRLMDRYALEVCVALCSGREVPDWVREALPALPELMEAGDRKAKAVERACVDLAEAVLLSDRVGEIFEGVVLDLNDRVDWDHNGKPDAGVVMLREPAVIGRLDGHDLPQGAELRVRLVSADPATRRVLFDWVDAV